MRFGVNYVPSKNWWYSWQDWDDASISEDLAAIRDLGLDHIRIHCLWPVFQPNAAFVSPLALGHLVRLHDLADRHGLDVQVTVLDGWLSGFKFYPAWLGDRNMFTDPEVIEAEERLFRAILGAVGAHPRFLGIDLGNELGVLQLIDQPATAAESDAWQARMLAVCESVAPGKLHVNGVDHNHWFRDFGFSREALATQGAMTSLHTWIEFAGARHFGSHLSAYCVRLPEYCIELAKAYHTDPARQVWVQEFGASKQWMPEEEKGEFARRTIEAAATCENVWGFTWWCSHDLGPNVVGLHPLEYDLGLLDCQNRPKPIGRDLASLVSGFSVAAVPRTTGLVMDDDAITQPSEPVGWSFARRYIEVVEANGPTAIVLRSRSGDSAYLASRGINTLVEA